MDNSQKEVLEGYVVDKIWLRLQVLREEKEGEMKTIKVSTAD